MKTPLTLATLKRFSALTSTAYCTDSPFQPLSKSYISRSLDCGETIVYTMEGLVVCSLRQSGDRFVMTGVTGTHAINGASNLERLMAHWMGFMQNNRDAYLKAMREAERAKQTAKFWANAKKYGYAVMGE